MTTTCADTRTLLAARSRGGRRARLSPTNIVQNHQRTPRSASVGGCSGVRNAGSVGQHWQSRGPPCCRHGKHHDESGSDHQLHSIDFELEARGCATYPTVTMSARSRGAAGWHFYSFCVWPSRERCRITAKSAEGGPKGGMNVQTAQNPPLYLVFFGGRGTRSAIPRVRQQAAILAAPATSPAGRRKLGEGDGGQG